MKKNLIVFDIDDTLIIPSKRYTKIYWVTKDGQRIPMTTQEFAENAKASETYDFSDFRDVDKIRKSILRGAIIEQNVELLRHYICDKNYDFAFLTARGCEDVVFESIIMKLYAYIPNDKIEQHFRKEYSFAINDVKYDSCFGNAQADKRKSQIMKMLTNHFGHVIYVDDDIKNITSVERLKLNDIMTIHFNILSRNSKNIRS